MATQLKHIDFTSTTAPTRRPNIRVAFIAGEAAAAVHDAMAKLPAEMRGATLDDLPTAGSPDVELIQSMTCSLIETARALLSPAMYTAFLRWGETAAHASSYYDSDDEGGMRCAAVADARTLVSETPADNTHDLLFAMLLTCIETADAPAFGPFDRSYGDFDVNGGDLLAGLSRDLRKFSPIPDLVNELSARAWNASNSRLAISLEIGAAITGAFTFARGEDDPARSTSLRDTGDLAISSAFATRRYEFENAERGPWSQEQEDAYFDRIDTAEMVLLNTPSATVEGVIAKLRVSFLYRVGTDWSDLAISNTSDPKFVEGLRMSDMHHRMAWGAIQDLARIGGVNLAEQGA